MRKILAITAVVMLITSSALASTRTIADGGGTWGDTACWVEEAVPTAADDVVATATSGNVTIAANAYCRSINLSTYTGTLTHNTSVSLNVGDASGGDFVFGSGMTYTPASGAAIYFVSSRLGNTITTNGKILKNVGFNHADGEWILQDNIHANYIGTAAGKFDANNKNVELETQASLSYGSTVVMGYGTWTLKGIGWWPAGGVVLSASQSTIILTGENDNSYFVGQGHTYGSVKIAAGNLNVQLEDSNTFNILELGAGSSIRIEKGTTQSIITSFIATGTAEDEIAISAVGSGGTPILSKSAASGRVTCDYLSLTDSVAAGGATWYAGSHSTDVSGNSGWLFEDAPAVVSSSALITCGD